MSDDMTDDTTDDTSGDTSEPITDPRTEEVEGDTGMPGEFVDTPNNLPGDQDEPDGPSLRDTKVDPDD